MGRLGVHDDLAMGVPLFVLVRGDGGAYGSTHTGADDGTFAISQLLTNHGADRTANAAANRGFDLVVVRKRRLCDHHQNDNGN